MYAKSRVRHIAYKTPFALSNDQEMRLAGEALKAHGTPSAIPGVNDLRRHLPRRFPHRYRPPSRLPPRHPILPLTVHISMGGTHTATDMVQEARQRRQLQLQTNMRFPVRQRQHTTSSRGRALQGGKLSRRYQISIYCPPSKTAEIRSAETRSLP